MNTSYEKLSFYNNFFSGSVEGDKIVSCDIYGNKQEVGVTLSAYQETLDLLNSYYKRLVELGDIVEEKTSEQIIQEQQDMMKEMMKQMSELKKQIETITHSSEKTNETINE